jgi:hypothetical protein
LVIVGQIEIESQKPDEVVELVHPPALLVKSLASLSGG